MAYTYDAIKKTLTTIIGKAINHGHPMNPYVAMLSEIPRLKRKARNDELRDPAQMIATIMKVAAMQSMRVDLTLSDRIKLADTICDQPSSRPTSLHNGATADMFGMMRRALNDLLVMLIHHKKSPLPGPAVYLLRNAYLSSIVEHGRQWEPSTPDVRIHLIPQEPTRGSLPLTGGATLSWAPTPNSEGHIVVPDFTALDTGYLASTIGEQSRQQPSLGTSGAYDTQPDFLYNERRPEDFRNASTAYIRAQTMAQANAQVTARLAAQAAAQAAGTVTMPAQQQPNTSGSSANNPPSTGTSSNGLFSNAPSPTSTSTNSTDILGRPIPPLGASTNAPLDRQLATLQTTTPGFHGFATSNVRNNESPAGSFAGAGDRATWHRSHTTSASESENTATQARYLADEAGNISSNPPPMQINPGTQSQDRNSRAPASSLSSSYAGSPRTTSPSEGAEASSSARGQFTTADSSPMQSGNLSGGQGTFCEYIVL